MTNIGLSQPPPHRAAAPAVEGGSASPQPPAEDEGMPIKALDLTTLEAYLGVVGASVVRATPLAGGGAGVATPSTPTGLGGGEAGEGVGFAPAGGVGVGAAAGAAEGLVARSASAGWSEAGEAAGGPAVKEGETAAQAAARAEFKRDTAGGWWAHAQGRGARAVLSWGGLCCRLCGLSWIASCVCHRVRALQHLLDLQVTCRGPCTALRCLCAAPNCTRCPACFACCVDDEDDFFSSDEDEVRHDYETRWVGGGCVSEV